MCDCKNTNVLIHGCKKACRPPRLVWPPVPTAFLHTDGAGVVYDGAIWKHQPDHSDNTQIGSYCTAFIANVQLTKEFSEHWHVLKQGWVQVKWGATGYSGADW